MWNSAKFNRNGQILCLCSKLWSEDNWCSPDLGRLLGEMRQAPVSSGLGCPARRRWQRHSVDAVSAAGEGPAVAACPSVSCASPPAPASDVASKTRCHSGSETATTHLMQIGQHFNSSL